MSFHDFPSFVYFFMNIHEYANELFSCRTTGCKDLTYHIRNDITTCSNADFGMKSVALWVFFTIFPNVLKISSLFMNMQII